MRVSEREAKSFTWCAVIGSSRKFAYGVSAGEPLFYVLFGPILTFFEQRFALDLSNGDTNEAYRPTVVTVFQVLRLFLRPLGGCLLSSRLF